MSAIQIEKDVPQPGDHLGLSAKYPWRSMQVGDSFLAPGVTSARMGGSMYQAAKATGFKFTSRTVEGGVRVWRIA